MTLLLVFGSTPDLAWQELNSMVPLAERTSPHTAVVHDGSVDPLNRLGGVTKIGRLSHVVSSIDASTLVPILSTEHFRSFGISTADTAPVSQALLARIKEELGKPVRYVSGQLSSVVITKQHVCELVVFPYRGKFGVAVTVSVQDFEGWTKRDRGRPYADPKAGMLPPKVARMMVNIAGSSLSQKTLLDPFCGMGTIVAEALLLGWQVIGSDQSVDAVKKAQVNLQWLGLSNKKWKFFVSDATHISEKIVPVDAIVTEPFMGKPDVPDEKVRDMVTGLEKLYIGCLKDWYAIVKPGGKVVMIVPRFVRGKKNYFVKKVIDSCETLGYTVLVGPIEYARPNAMVKREIFVFTKLV
ncbi:hypothetical protein A2875_00020 [Candidatus Gottesmanbacteria bacterium RIFCSPHIGHO2_01_FULL_46_14]|uniref:Ribosomal RNA large subunit methyltransferase K/L-like methyltransferase domain-containing protein n=2 Tax=Candidatus Gottesmaniibacteriota TaxID=1752720 RepID=A0A1F5ZR10_9BACT|nr:MAG: hypothetical protein A2875_00020 [Candidatus Gottesmanbacteria bacterium RIFCSPHIGHO2_01_FULL_46_14]OGG28708.1 MAG: hypothetical protein A2971_00055 [Candidatus Gottesmanbacteria bacterium RIFCSPLOWO2_01_FULL_46_21]